LITVDNYVDKCVENGGITMDFLNEEVRVRDIHRVIYRFFASFPRFFAGKRYKLINFAPKSEIVDN